MYVFTSLLCDNETDFFHKLQSGKHGQERRISHRLLSPIKKK